MSTATTQIIISGKDQLSSVVADAGRRVGTELEAIQRNVLNLQNAFVGLAGAAALGQIRQSHTEYDTALRDMAKVTSESMDAIAAKVREIPAELGTSATLIRGYYQVISSGITDPVKAMATLTSSVEAAKAAHVDQAEVIKGITKVMAGYAGDVKTAAEAADLLFTIEKQGQTSFAELIPVIGDVSAISKQLGVDQKEMGAALAAVTLTAGSTSQAATQYRMMLVNLLKPTKNMQEALDAMGVSSGQAAIEQFGLAGTLQRLQLYADRSGTSVAKLFESSEALLSVAALSRGEFAQYNTNLQAMEQGGGAAAEAFEKWRESSQAVDDLLRNTMTNTLVKIGGEIMPKVNDSVREFAGFVAAHDDEIAGTFGRLAEYGETIGSAVVPALKDVGSVLQTGVLPPLAAILETANATMKLVPGDYQSSVGAGIIGYALLGPKGAVIAASIAAIDASMNRLTQTTWELMGGTGNYAAVHDQLREKGKQAFYEILTGQLGATHGMHTYRAAIQNVTRVSVAGAKEQASALSDIPDELGNIYEQATRKNSAELKKQEAARKKFIADAVKSANGVQDMWLVKDKERMEVLSRTYDVMQHKEDELAKVRKDAAAEALKVQEAQEKDAQKVMDNIQDATADVFYDMFSNIGDGWENLWDSMKSWALRTLAELAARAATVNIVVPIMTSMTGTTNATQAVQAITGGQGGGPNLSSLSSLVQPGSMLSKIPGMSTVTGLLATQLPGTTMLSGGAMSLAAGGTAGGPVASLAAAQNLAGMTGGLSIGAALGFGAMGGLGYSLLGPSLGLPQNQYSGITSSLGGALGAWGGSALGASSAGAALGATVGSALPVVGTIAGALVGGLASTLFGGDKGSPSIIFNAQTTEWGSTDSTRAGNGGSFRDGFEFHTKSGAKMKHGEPIATALEAVATNAFTTIESTLASFGDGYVDMLDGAVVEFGRKTKGVAGGSWDFDAEEDMDKLLEEYAGKLQDAILQAAAGAFTAAGQDIASGDDAMGALGMLAEANAEQFRSLQDALAAGVQSGNVEAYIAQLQSFQATVQAITATWDAVNAAADDLVKPPTAYESAVRQANAQFDAWVDTLRQMGFAEAKVAELEDKRAATLARLNSEMGPIAEAEAAQKAAAEDAQAAVDRARSNLLTAYRQEATELQRVKDKWDNFADALKRWRQDFLARSSHLSLSDRALVTQARWDDISRRAQLGDEEAIQELTSAADAQLTVAKDTAETAEDYARTAARTLATVEGVEILSFRQASVAERQLSALEQQVSQLVSLNDGIQSVEQAIRELAAAQSAAAAAQRAAAAAPPTSVAQAAAQGYITSPVSSSGSHTGIGDSGYRLVGNTLYFPGGGSHSVSGPNAAETLMQTYGLTQGGLNGTLIRTRASGGYTPAGLTLVGEEGPELVNFDRPGMVYDASQTEAILSGRSRDATASEVRALREDLRAIGRALARNTLDTAKLMRRWDGDGMPETRSVA